MYTLGPPTLTCGCHHQWLTDLMNDQVLDVGIGRTSSFIIREGESSILGSAPLDLMLHLPKAK